MSPFRSIGHHPHRCRQTHEISESLVTIHIVRCGTNKPIYQCIHKGHSSSNLSILWNLIINQGLWTLKVRETYEQVLLSTPTFSRNVKPPRIKPIGWSTSSKTGFETRWVYISLAKCWQLLVLLSLRLVKSYLIFSLLINRFNTVRYTFPLMRQ